MSEPLLPPIGMLAELTHRCPLQCPYCSNPTELLKANREMDTAAWLELFDQAADLGVLQVHLSGGEPTLRRDLEQLVAGLSRRGVYANLITAGVNLSEERIHALVDAGLDHVQVSFQGAHAATTERIGNSRGAHEKKIQTARHFRSAGLPLTINAPIHRHNIEQVPDFIELALSLGAERLEIANVQYAGWALVNRDALMPDRASVERQAEIVEVRTRAAARDHEYRLRYARLFRDLSQTLYGRLGARRLHGCARRHGASLPCRAYHSLPDVRTFRRALAGGDLDRLASLQCFPRNRLDVGALPEL